MWTICNDSSPYKEIETRRDAHISYKKDLILYENISLPAKVKLYKSLRISILVYEGESWTLTVFEYKYYRKIICICYLEHKISIYVRDKVNSVERCFWQEAYCCVDRYRVHMGKPKLH